MLFYVLLDVKLELLTNQNSLRPTLMVATASEVGILPKHASLRSCSLILRCSLTFRSVAALCLADIFQTLKKLYVFYEQK